MFVSDKGRDSCAQQLQCIRWRLGGRLTPQAQLHGSAARASRSLPACDVTVTDTLADFNLAASSSRPGQLAREAARRKEEKYRDVAAGLNAVHLPFAIETMGGLSESAQQLIREIHYSAGSHCTWRDADAIGTHLVDSIAIAVQRCTGMALQASMEKEMQRAMGARAA